MKSELLSIGQASQWASDYLDRPVTTSNISYLIQYAKISRYLDTDKKTKIKLQELKQYYDENIKVKHESWKDKLGKDLDWGLSFSNLRESDTTKHVHRLHPYKGKFIPQLVEYFLDSHLNDYKKQIYFKAGDTILDPFMGSGTTLIQSSELGLNSVGIDISDFNCLIAKTKLDDYDFVTLNESLQNVLSKTSNFSQQVFDDAFDIQLKNKLNEFNKKHFPNPEFKNKIRRNELNEDKYAEEKLKLFFKENEEFFRKNGTKDKTILLDEKRMSIFLAKWFSKRVRQELFYYLKTIEQEKDEKIRNMMKIVLSRTARSCRATTHSDLATLKEPQTGPYYCSKHKKICTPLNNIITHLRRYTIDTIERIKEFSKIKRNVFHGVIHADSRETDIFKEIKKQNPAFFKLLNSKKIDGIFSSPPYVGQIDYHEQHAYAYELFEIERKDDKEIGPLYKGQGNRAKRDYIEGISKVFKNINKFVKEDGDFFIVANDKYNLYPEIAEKSGLKIVEQFKRPVLNRTERDRQPYAEIIFHMKKA
ncbi:TPA: site-specific DNA-methyltransferase [Candidatus Woesearchaeota archaeon]|nr:site-specific DNA-methyltransferase [Candidatus Woesearchaeota archaeon]